MDEKQTAQPSPFGKHVKLAGQEFVLQWRSLLPDNFWKHRREVRRQMLLATSSLINGVIEKLDPDAKEDDTPTTSRRKTKIEIEKNDD